MKIKQISALFVLFTLTYIIFNFSLQPAYISDEQSGLFVRISLLILENFPNIQISKDILTTIIRKTAHFLEYGALGVSVSLVVYTFKEEHKRYKWWYLYGFIIPIIDEIIQSFVPGRSCQVSDMLLDMSGYVTGLVGMLIVNGILQKLTKKKS